MILSWIMNVFGVGNSNLPYSKIVEMFRNEQVKSFVVEDHTIELKLTAPYNGKTTVTASMADPEGFRQELGALFEEQVAAGILESYDFLPGSPVSPFDYILPLLIVGIILLMLWAMLMGKLNSANPLQNFGKARTVLGIPDGKKVTFADVAGADEEKAELQEVVDFLRDPDK